jgi:hypothetical protein
VIIFGAGACPAPPQTGPSRPHYPALCQKNESNWII